MQEVAAKLQGFPIAPSDVREVKFGPFGPKSLPGRRATLKFYYADNSGHAYVDSKVESDYNVAGKIESVSLSLQIEAAAVDSFVQELHELGSRQTGVAFLKGAPSLRVTTNPEKE